MCLEIVYRGKEKKDALAKLPKSGYYWKKVLQQEASYYPPVMIMPGNRPYKVGWNTTKLKYEDVGYGLGFHLWRKKGSNGGRIRCIIKRTDIVAIGKQWGQLCIVTKRFWIPKPKTKPT